MASRASHQALFPTDSPLPPDQMIGRADDVERLVLAVGQGAHQVVAGPRRTGKTTVCRAVLERAVAEGSYAVAVDLFRLGDLGDFTDTLVTQAIANRPAVRRALSRGRIGAREIVRSASLTPVARLRGELGADIEVAFGSRRVDDPVDRFRSAMSLLVRLTEVDSVHLVLHIDEIQELAHPTEPFGDPDRITKLMRSVLQDAPRITTIFSGSQEHLLRDLLSPRHRAFYAWGSWVRLGPIDTEAWEEGLTARFRLGGFTIAATAVDRLLNESEGHPRTTMLIAQQCAVAGAVEHLEQLDDWVVPIGVEQAMAADAGLHQELTVELRSMGRHVLSVASRIARGDAPYGPASAGRVAASSIQRAIDSLERAGVVERRGARGRGGWVVVDPLARRFLADQG